MQTKKQPASSAQNADTVIPLNKNFPLQSFEAGSFLYNKFADGNKDGQDSFTDMRCLFICKNSGGTLRPVDIIHNPLPDLARAIPRCTFNLYFRCAHLLFKARINGMADEFSLFG